MHRFFFQNVEDWQLDDESRGVENLNDPIDDIFPKQHSLTETNAKIEVVKENGHHLNGARVNGNGMHEDPNGHKSLNEDEDSNDEPNDVGNENNGKETGCEAGTTYCETIEDEPATPVPYYGRTLVAPEYMNFQLPGDTFQRDERDTEDSNDIDAAVGDRSRDMDNTEKSQVQQQKTLCQFDEIGHEQEDITLAEDGSHENGNHNRDGKNREGDERAEDEDQKDKREEEKELLIGSTQLAQAEEEHDEEIEDDGRDQQTKGEDESDETGAEEEEEKGDDEVDEEHGGVHENDADGEDEDKAEVDGVDQDYEEGVANRDENCEDRADEKEKFEVVAVEDNEEEEVGENNEEKGANEGEEENDGAEKNSEEANEQEKEDHVEEDNNEERAHKEDFIEQNKEDEIHENNGVAEDEELDEEEILKADLTLATQNESFTQLSKGDVEDDNQDEEIDQEDMAIRTKLTLEHWDSLKVNVASPTRDITEVASAESLNELEADQTEEDEEEEDEEDEEKEEEEEEKEEKEEEEEEEEEEAPGAQQESLKTNVDQHEEATVTVGMS